MRAKIIFLLGIVSSILLLFLFVISAAVFYKTVSLAINKADFRMKHADLGQINRLTKEFFLSFEGPEELSIFTARNAGLSWSNKFASEGSHSMLVEFPAGIEDPGFIFESTAGSCFDWTGFKEFAFDVVNDTDISVSIAVRIKTNADDYTRVYEHSFDIPSKRKYTVRISKAELEGLIDFKKICYLNIFTGEPSTTFYLYFDNMRVVRE